MTKNGDRNIRDSREPGRSTTTPAWAHRFAARLIGTIVLIAVLGGAALAGFVWFMLSLVR